MCNWVKPESTDHCCTITFLQKRTEKSKREGKKREVCQETHPWSPANGLCSIRLHSYYSEKALGWNTKTFWLSLQRKPQTVLMGVNIPLCQHGIQYQPDAIYTMSIKDNPLSLLWARISVIGGTADSDCPPVASGCSDTLKGRAAQFLFLHQHMKQVDSVGTLPRGYIAENPQCLAYAYNVQPKIFIYRKIQLAANYYSSG